MKRLVVLCVLFAAAAPAAAQTPDHHAQMTARGDHAMGFDQSKATHHFLLYEDGGAVEITVKDRQDRATLDAVRAHLPHIVQLFAAGDFSVPGFIHDRPVPGTAAMTTNKDRIAYVYEEIVGGGRLRITTRAAAALIAVHEFLRFQITDHKTGDPLEVTRKP
jgi:hypothetical protein